MRRLLSWYALVVLGCSALMAQSGGRISSVQLKKPNVVIRGAHLSKVEIWAFPTGTGLGDQHLVFGSAVRNGPAGSNETWMLRLPKCSTEEDGYLAAQVVAVGLDARGREVARKDLRGLGAIELYKTLCAK